MFFKETGLEAEQVVLFLHINKQKVRELDSEQRSVSYDYLQTGDGSEESQSRTESLEVPSPADPVTSDNLTGPAVEETHSELD